MINRFWSGFILLLVLSGCGWDGTPTRHNDFTPLTSIEIVAVSTTIAAKTSTRLAVKGNFSGLFTRDITNEAVWSSASPAVAGFITVTSPNRVTGQGPGTAVLTATVGAVSGTFNLTVSDATATALTITPAAPSIAKGLNSRLGVSGAFSDDTTQDLTFDAVWTSSDTAVATIGDIVEDKSEDKRIVTALAAGTATISATFGAVSGTTLLTVTAAVLQSITVTPANSSITGFSKPVTFVATGTFSDGTTADITSQAAWSSSRPEIATIPATGGVATTVAAGTTSISAALNGISGKTDLIVTAPALIANGLKIAPVSLPLLLNSVSASGRFTVTATFTDGTTKDVTASSEWSSNFSNIASVNNIGTDKGLVTGVTVGSATI
ncbi:MAG: Ig-like domain-containing protein, partial [Steroidobacteraceae bacterium]|nr:Ig-like domain-containing protein [Deltaproteobacteria bacterium]